MVSCWQCRCKAHSEAMMTHGYNPCQFCQSWSGIAVTISSSVLRPVTEHQGLHFWVHDWNSPYIMLSLQKSRCAESRYMEPCRTIAWISSARSCTALQKSTGETASQAMISIGCKVCLRPCASRLPVLFRGFKVSRLAAAGCPASASRWGQHRPPASSR